MNPIPEGAEQPRTTLEDSARRLAAAVSGAMEGFVEALDEYDIQEEAKRAAHHSAQMGQAIKEEGKAQARPSERGMTQEAQDAQQTATGAGGAAATGQSMRRAAHDAADAMREGIDHARERAAQVKDEVKIRGQAVAETSRRATRAPPRIMQAYRGAARAWWSGTTSTFGAYALIGLLGLTAFIVLTIALVVGFNGWMGDPGGTLLVALLYVALAGLAYAWTRKARTRARDEVKAHMDEGRKEVQDVTRPVRQAFGRGRPGT